MSEVVVVVTMQCRPGKEQEMVETLTADSATTHREQGCTVYAMHQGADDPTRFSIVEVWASREDLDRHLALPEVQGLIGRIDALAEGQPSFAIYDALPAGDPAKGTLSGGRA